MPLRIAQFSDLHYAEETLDEVDRCFTRAVDQAIAAGIDAAIITGDSTDHALNAHSPALAALARQIRRLADHCPVLMLQGTFSHEPPGLLSLLAMMRGKHPICIADRLQQVVLTQAGNWVVSDSWRFETLPDDVQLLCTCIPTLNRAALAAMLGARDAAEAIGDQLAQVMAGYAPGHLAARQQGIPVVALSHGTVHGCLTEHGVPMAGTDHEFNIETLFRTAAMAIMLGHIHKHQCWKRDGQVIAYAGSIGRLHYGEEDTKGFLLWTVDSHQANIALVPTPARVTVDLAFAGPPDMEALEAFVAQNSLDSTWVRVRWQVMEEERDQVDRARIEQMLRGAAGLKLEGRVIPVTRARASGMATESSLPRQIEQWATATGTSPEIALSCLEQLRHGSPEQIAQQILHAPEPKSEADIGIVNTGEYC